MVSEEREQEITKIINDIFKPGGRLSEVFPGYERRPEQFRFAATCAFGVCHDKHVLAEAATGCGKSLGALLPVLIAKNPGETVIVSTQSLALQDQYFYKDLPLIAKVLEPYMTIKFARAKGKQNFVCWTRLDDALGELSFTSDDTAQKLVEWARASDTGDRGDISFRVENSLWNKVCCEEICLKGGCGYNRSGKCFFGRARAEYADADVIVTNHYMYLLNSSIGGHLLGPHDIAIFDEGHTLVECAQSTLGTTLSAQTLTGFFTHLHSQFKKFDIWPANVNYASMREALEKTEKRMWNPLIDWARKNAVSQVSMSEVPQNVFAFAKCDMAELLKYAADISNMLNKADKHDNYDDSTMQFLVKGLSGKLSEHKRLIRQVFDPSSEETQENWCTYLEAGKNVYVHCRPINVAPLLRNMVFESNDPKCSPRSTITMSATLTVGKSFDFITRELGLFEPVTTIVPSPFDLKNQIKGYLPTHIPDKRYVDYERYIGSLVNECVDLINLTRGSALVLFTCYSDMSAVGEALKKRISYNVLVQGDMSKNKLVEEFKRDISSVLVATKTYWTGIDVPGDALRNVIITKLPFRVSDPLFAAKCEVVKKNGGNDFMDLQLPMALMELKQAAGRLIRTKTDEGVLAILDSRALKARYGGLVKQSLPPMTMIETINSRQRVA